MNCKDEKLKVLLEKISHLYIKYGIKSVSMDDIARELGISKKTLYLYFKDKNDLVFQVVAYHIKNQNDYFCLIAEQKLNAIDVLLDVSKRVIMFMETFNSSIRYDLQKYHPEVLKIFTEHRRDHILKNIKNNILKGIEEGIYRNDLIPDVIANLYVTRIDLMFNNDALPENQFTFSMIFDEMFKYHIRGIASKKGIEYYESKIKTHS